MKFSDNLSIKLFADGAELEGIKEMYSNPDIRGFTTNPTLMRRANISDYEKFANAVLENVPDLPVSFEVFADDFDEMERQARKISGWGRNVNVKIPIMNTKGHSSIPTIKKLTADGVALNVTAVMTTEQVEAVAGAISVEADTIISVFAGRIADTGRDPIPLMKKCLEILSGHKNSQLLWASPREVLNVFQANEIGCHIITATNDILKKLNLFGKDLTVYSQETVDMFYRDAAKAGYHIE